MLARLVRHQRWVILGMSAVLLALLGQLLYRERDTLLTYPWHIQPPFLLVAFAGHGLATWGTFWLWRLMLRRLSGPVDLTWQAHAAIYFPTSLAKRIPGTIWYAAGRVVVYESQGIPTSATLVAMVLEMAVLFLAGVIFLLLSLPLVQDAPGLSLAALAALPPWLLPVFVLGTLALLWPGVLAWVINRVRRWRGRPAIRLSVDYQDLLSWVGIDLLVWLAAGLGFYGVVNVVYPAAWSDVAFMITVSTLATLASVISFVVPVLPLVREATVSVLLTPIMPLGVAVIVAILFRVWWTLCDIFWAMLIGQLWSGRLSIKPPPTPLELL